MLTLWCRGTLIHCAKSTKLSTKLRPRELWTNSPYPNFPVAQCAQKGLPVKRVHFGETFIFLQPLQQNCSLITGQEFGLFRPVDNEPFCYDCNRRSQETLDDEDPKKLSINSIKIGPLRQQVFTIAIQHSLQARPSSPERMLGTRSTSILSLITGADLREAHPAERSSNDTRGGVESVPFLHLIPLVVHPDQIYIP